MRTGTIFVAAMVAGAAFILPVATTATDLADFLTEIEDAGHFQTPARADMRIHVKGTEGEREFDGVVVHRGTDVYLELREPPLRALISAGGQAVHQKSGNAAGPALTGGAYDTMGVTTLIPDDFRPFRAGTLRTPQIANETKRTLLVSGAPTDASPYVLQVYLLDREKLVPTRVQYYERTLSNLVRMRRDTDVARIAGVWRPRRTEIEDYRTGAVTTIERRWTTDPDLPSDLFDPAKLAARSPLGPP